MLNLQRSCMQCGAEMQSIRSTKTYCSDACRKRAERGGIERQAESKLLVKRLSQLGLIGKVYPVYSWDTSPSVFALMVTTRAACEELNLYGSTATEAELERALRECEIETIGAGERVKAEIRAFYDARKDRRLREGHTPSDKEMYAP